MNFCWNLKKSFSCFEAKINKYRVDACSEHRLQIRKCVKKKVRVGKGYYSLNDESFYHIKNNILESISYLLPLASKTSFTEWCAKPSQASTLICWACCVILACSEVGTWNKNFVIDDETNAWITNFLPLVISSHKSRVGARKARECAFSRFTYL
jgi:hypothetical protein